MIKSGVCPSYLMELALGTHLVTDDYRMALFGEDAELTPDIRKYTPTGECKGSGYEKGGKPIKAKVFQVGTDACIGFSDPVWDLVTLTAAGAIIYNASRNNRVVAVLRFPSTKSAGNGPFKVRLPKYVVKIGVSSAKPS